MPFAGPSTTASQDLVSNTDTGFLSSFIYSITSYEYTIPLWIQITMIVIIMIILITGGYFAYDMFDMRYTKNGFIWFIFVAFLNLTSILAVLIYYNIKNARDSNNLSTAYIGTQGRQGNKGRSGKTGTSVLCNYCNNDIYLKRIKNADPIATFRTYTPDFTTIKDKITYFNKLIALGDINYDSFVNAIILGKAVVPDSSKPNQQQSIDNFRILMNPKYIAIHLIENINATITKASKDTYGIFKKPSKPSGFLSLGDSVYGGTENFSLNSFLVGATSDIMYPPSYTLIVTVQTDVNTYSIWRPDTNSQSDTSTSNILVNYNRVGDICYIGNTPPPFTNPYCALINENCLDIVNYKDLTLVFIYVGSISLSSNTSDANDYTQSETYLINNNNNTVIDIDIFSTWRTPLNTFITKSNSNSKLTNNTILENMVENLTDTKTDYGSINSATKQYVTDILQSVTIPKILVATTICNHYELELRKELIYYINRYNTHFPNLPKNTALIQSPFGDLMNGIDTQIKSNDKDNADLIKKAAVDLSTDSGSTYDASLEKHIPQTFLNVYNTIKTQLLTISVKIENTNTFLELINELFDNSINTRIAVNSTGIAQGGILLNVIQKTIVRLCKMLMPPSDQPAYTIKDECLGLFSLNRDREEAIKDFTDAKDKYEKINEIVDDKIENIISEILSGDLNSSINKNKKKYKEKITKLQKTKIDTLTVILDNKVGNFCGYIDNYPAKIHNMELDEFTPTRLKGLTKIYDGAVRYLIDINSGIDSNSGI